MIMRDKTTILLNELRKNETIKSNKLQKILNCDGRTIRYHISILRKLNYNIISIIGPAGGYKLIEEKLTALDWHIIKNSDIHIYEKLKRIFNKA